MTQSVKQLRKTITSVKNTSKITRTMQLISAARLQKVTKPLKTLHSYIIELANIQERLAKSIQNLYTPNLEKPHLVLVFAADRGLCGGFNSEITKQSASYIRALNTPTKVICIGKKTASLGNLEGVELSGIYPSVGKELTSTLLQPVINEVTALIENRELNSITVIYTHYISAFRQEIRIEPLFPIPSEDKILAYASIEPNVSTVTAALLNKILSYKLYSAWIESSASEQTARMNAMKNATDSTKEIIDSLSLEINKSRQQQITQEIAQIVSSTTI